MTNILRKYFLICLSLACFASSCTKDHSTDADNNPDSPASMTQHVFASTSNENIGYWLYTPANAKAGMPLIIYLHGGSGRGNDLNLVIGGSLPKFLHEGTIKDIPAFILMPQCPAGKTWEQTGASVIELIDQIASGKKIDTKKISLTGHSLGGSGTWRLGATYFSKFSCIAPLSGSADMNAASSYTGFPVWAFAGSADDIVSPNSSSEMIAKINSLGGNAQLKIYEGATHFDVPDLTYKDTDSKLLEWMINQKNRRKDEQEI